MAIKKIGNPPRKAGFTLVELLVVIAIGAIITTLSITSYTKVLNSGALTTTTQAVIGLLDHARQTAITRNAAVEVRFYELPSPTSSTTAAVTSFRAMQSFLVTNSGYTPLGKPLFFTNPIAIQYSTAPVTGQSSDITHNTLLNAAQDTSLDVTGTPNNSLQVRDAQGAWGAIPLGLPAIGTIPLLPTYGANYKAVTFRFAPKGNLMTLDASKQWYFTILSSNDKITDAVHNLPSNYSVLQIDGFTGKTSYYRP